MLTVLSSLALVLFYLSGIHAGYGEHHDNYVAKGCETNTGNIVEEMQKKLSALELNIDNKIGVLQNLEQNILKAVKDNQYLGCKEYHVFSNGYSVYFNMDANTLNHVAYRKDLNGGLYFEMHLAIKGTTVNIMIAPSEEAYTQGHKKYFEFAIYSANIVWFDMGKQIGNKAVPDMISTERFTPIFIKMYNDTLEVGKEGGLPLLTYSHERLKPSGRFGFSTVSRESPSTILYDCPLIVF